MIILGPLTCPNPMGSVVVGATYITNGTAYNNCTALNNFYMQSSQHKRNFLNTCIGQYREYGFVQGVNGYLTEVDSMGVHSCSRGDYRMWFTLELCCPGMCHEYEKQTKENMSK